MGKRKGLNEKQLHALDLLTNGQGMRIKDIAKEVGVEQCTLWRWRHSPEYPEFQQRLKEINEERWLCTVDAAREAAYRLVQKDNQRMVEFVLKNEGYNPTQKVEADLSTDINITIGDDAGDAAN